uniref:NADH dehydrogenase subunit 2 n=1 Tax=Leptopalpus rostratus TaxID=2914704 RepID=UPI001FA761BD|nr:NADH dehydrogenase subunit 2 [Leptopalpus rostratus]UMR54899.1 NADH dehydrogenase subunit 2 [Leptopalpus rostratus]
MIKLYKILFFNMMIMGTMITISSYTWFSMWMGLEINLLSFIPLLSSTKNMYASEASLKYFITQTMASLILLLSVIMMLMTNEFITPMVNLSFMTVLNSALMMKLGAAPFHFWFPEVMEGLNWMNCSILLTWQKIAPFMLIMNSSPSTSFMFAVIFTSLIVSTALSLNQVSLRKILAFSSINHMAWMLSASMVDNSIWMIYFVVYTIITVNLTFIFNQGKLYFMSQIPSFMNSNKNIKLSFMINFLSLGGLPPFLGFMPKWFTINSLILNNMALISLILIMLTLIMLFVYVRISMTTLVFSYSEPKLMQTKFNQTTSLTINFLTIFSLISCTIMFNFF